MLKSLCVWLNFAFISVNVFLQEKGKCTAQKISALGEIKNVWNSQIDKNVIKISKSRKHSIASSCTLNV